MTKVKQASILRGLPGLFSEKNKNPTDVVEFGQK
jgi:hypothetical protein